MKALLFDASSIISLAMNGLFEEIRELKKIFKGKFLITKEVKYEIIDRPMKIKRFELEALKINQLLEEGIFEMPSSMGVNDDEISASTKNLLEIANKTFFGGGKEIKLIDLGEASCLAFSKILNEKKINNVIIIDERTTRMLGEKPENLKKLLRRKLHTKVDFKKENFNLFKGFKFIRSTELIYVAFKKGLIKLRKDNVLDALLWALKFKGCAISGEEINEIKKLK